MVLARWAPEDGLSLTHQMGQEAGMGPCADGSSAGGSARTVPGAALMSGSANEASLGGCLPGPPAPDPQTGALMCLSPRAAAQSRRGRWGAPAAFGR